MDDGRFRDESSLLAKNGKPRCIILADGVSSLYSCCWNVHSSERDERHKKSVGYLSHSSGLRLFEGIVFLWQKSMGVERRSFAGLMK